MTKSPRWLLILLWAFPVISTVTSELRFARHRAWEHHSDDEVRLMVQREEYETQRDNRSRAVSTKERVGIGMNWTLEKNSSGKIIGAYAETHGPACIVFLSGTETFELAKRLFERRPMSDGTITTDVDGPWNSH